MSEVKANPQGEDVTSKGKPRCKAHSRTSGGRCGQPCVEGRSTCRYHGGKTPRGLALPQTTNGLESKDIKTRLAARALAAINDPHLMDLSASVARQRSIVEELWSQVGEGGSYAVVRAVMASWRAYRSAPPQERAGKLNAHEDAVEALGTLLDVLRQMDEVGQHMDREARLVTSAAKSNLDGLLAARFATELGLAERALAMAAEKHLPDPKARRAFLIDAASAFDGLMHRVGMDATIAVDAGN